MKINAAYCDKIYVLKDGVLEGYGTPEEVLTALLDGRFMADAALVAADCLARHEGLGADSPDVLRLLHPPHLAGFTV